MKMRFIKKIFTRENLYRLLFIIGSLFISLLICEFSLRAFYAIKDRNDKYFVWPPNIHETFMPRPGIKLGVKGPCELRTNSEGIRGDEFSDDQKYRILAIGGSTTFCLDIDQPKSWPYAVQNKLNHLQKLKVWVGNVGKLGARSRDHLLHVKYLLPQYPKIDAIILLVGCNDAMRRLAEDASYDPLFLDNYEYWERKLFKEAFSKTPYYTGKYRIKTGYYYESAIGGLVKRVVERSTEETIPLEDGSRYEYWRSLRKNAKEIVDVMPDLTSSLTEYEKNLNMIINEAHSRSVRVIFMTNPYLYKSNMTQSELDLLWFGAIDKPDSGRYYSTRVMAEVMQLYSSRTIKVCKDRGVECIDLDAQLPQDTTVLFDDFHFNDNGCDMVAEILSRYLSQTKPFCQVRKQLFM